MPISSGCPRPKIKNCKLLCFYNLNKQKKHTNNQGIKICKTCINEDMVNIKL